MESTESGASQSPSVGGTQAATVGGLRFSQLSVPARAIVRLCQRVNHGSIQGLCVKDTEPVFNPPPLRKARRRRSASAGASDDLHSSSG